MALEEYEECDPYEKWLDPCGYTWPDPNHRGRVYTWGNNDQGWGEDGDENKSNGGRLGNGSATDSNSTPVLVLRGEQPPDEPNDTYPYLCHIVAISAGEAHSMALDVNGYVYTWGDNQHGQLGNGTTDQNLAPVRVVGEDGIGDLEGIVAIAAGYWHSIAVDVNGTIWTWGKGSAGRLGLANKTIDCNTPHPIPVVYNITQETFAFAIQTAIDDANDAGDILEASPGTYYENVNFKDKSVALRSTEPTDPTVVADTIVDARYNAGDSVDDYYPVNYNNGSGSSVAGLTLSESVKGGVNCVNLSSAYLSNCAIQDNSWDGIYLNDASVHITGCRIRRNATASDRDYCGIYCESGSDVNIVGCILSDNEGSGISCEDSSLGITNCTIEDNEDRGVYAKETTLGIMTCIFRNNGDYGIEAHDNCDLSIAQSLIKGNGEGGVYALIGCDFVLNRSIVCDNGWDGLQLEYKFCDFNKQLDI